MKVISKISADLVRRSVTQYISASQFDANARAVAVTLTADGQPWNPPANAVASVVFRNLQAGHKGRYDTMPDGSPACLTEGNVVTATLAPAVLASPGEVTAAIVFQDQDLKQIATFRFYIMVEENPESGEPAGNDYVNFTPGNIDDTTVGKQAWSSQRIQAELDVMRDQTDNLSGIIDNVYTYTENSLTDINETKAEIDDEKIGSDAWSSKNTVDKLCLSFSESGEIVHCEAVEDYPLAVETELEASADGYTKVMLLSSGKNMLAYPYAQTTKTTKGIKFTDNGDGSITINGTATDSAYLTLLGKGNFNFTKAYTATKDDGIASRNGYSLLLVNGNSNVFLCHTNGGEIHICVTTGTKVENLTVYPQIEYGTAATEYEPPSGQVFTLHLDEAIYGGKVMWDKGQLLVTHGAGGAELPEAYTKTITKAEILGLTGANTLKSSTGNTIVSGKADPTAVIEKLTNAIIALGGNV